MSIPDLLQAPMQTEQGGDAPSESSSGDQDAAATQNSTDQDKQVGVALHFFIANVSIRKQKYQQKLTGGKEGRKTEMKKHDKPCF